MKNYYDFECFKGVYLEDSFVLKIKETAEELVFFIEAVLTEEHPHFTQPKTNEHYCYRTAEIIFPKLKSVNWLQKNDNCFIEVNSDIDYGNIDLFEILDGEYYLSGDWGEVKVRSSPVIFRLN